MMGRYLKVPLGECCEIISGATPKISVEAYWDGELRWATPRDLSNLENPYIADTPRKISEAGLRSCAARLLPTGSVLLSSRAPIGHVAINVVPMATNQGFKSLVPDPLKVDAKYLYHWLRVNRSYLESLGNGATFKEISKEVVSRIELPLPPIVDQRRIAEVLDQTGMLRSKRREATAQLDKLAQSIFLEMFGELTSNPYGWPLSECQDVCRRITVGVVVRPASYYQKAGIPALRSFNKRPNLISSENLVYFSPQDNEARLTKTRVWAGDVLLVRSGQPGTAAVVPDEFNGANSIDVLIATPERSKMHPVFLSFYFNSLAGKRMVVGEQRGQIQKHLNVSSLKVAPIPAPPLALQHEFARRVATIDRAKEKNCAHLAELDALFASLQYRAFRGEL